MTNNIDDDYIQENILDNKMFNEYMFRSTRSERYNTGNNKKDNTRN